MANANNLLRVTAEDLIEQYGNLIHGWRIETRQREVLGILGRHNYLALVNGFGVVVEELHGWDSTTGKMSFIRYKRLTETRAIIDNQPVIDGAESIVVNRGFAVSKSWANFINTGKNHHQQHEYFFAGSVLGSNTFNSNGFWRTLLEDGGFNWQKYNPSNSLFTPGIGDPLPEVNPLSAPPNIIELAEDLVFGDSLYDAFADQFNFEFDDAELLNNSLLQVETDTLLVLEDEGATDLNGEATAVEGGYLIIEPTHSARSTDSVINSDGYANTLIGEIITGGIRPGNGNMVNNAWQVATEEAATSHYGQQQAIPQFFQTTYNAAQSGAVSSTYIDPLILDLNGDGVQLLDADNAKVLFDIDHDGVTEQTGWVSAEDGIVVIDLNNDGRINSSKEMLSEYYNGVQGTGGSAGSTPYANGFEALASLDSNNDKLFDRQDAAWGTVKVWVDGNSNGETDAGELHTLASLDVVSINLDAEAQSGAILDGNEVLASSTFTINPGSGNEEREAIAANFIANPDGHTVTETTGGTRVISQNGITSFASTDDSGVTLSVSEKGVQSVYGARGDDTLIGDGNDNWLGGGRGSDTLLAA